MTDDKNPVELIEPSKKSLEKEAGNDLDLQTTLSGIQTIAGIFRSISEPEAEAQVKKAEAALKTAELEHDFECKRLEVLAKAAERGDRHKQERFRWNIGWAYLVTLFLLAVTGFLIHQGDTKNGLLVVSHLAAGVAGLMAGRGLGKRKEAEEESDSE